MVVVVVVVVVGDVVVVVGLEVVVVAGGGGVCVTTVSWPSPPVTVTVRGCATGAWLGAEPDSDGAVVCPGSVELLWPVSVYANPPTANRSAAAAAPKITGGRRYHGSSGCSTSSVSGSRSKSS